ncbi:host attachment protein [Desulfonatronum sp. SC1]|uniref:host attachment protein n=1 Tax=Desulfonatronum sp. SC1 TaxID=2109626 RepID=UPI000D3050D4|nr:host attachment protein [Desulfonatronum sp. SC1]PTN37698.1 host attachment protein [Desulfonatronum sp. SC1]
MRKRWIVVADSSKARFFNAPVSGKLEEVETLTHPESRLPGQDMCRDRPGLALDGGGHGRHGLEPSSDPKKQEALIFSRIVSDMLDKAHGDRRFEQLGVFAAPAFLGMLRDQMSKAVAGAVFLEVPKNISAQTTPEIQKHLAAELDK